MKLNWNTLAAFFKRQKNTLVKVTYNFNQVSSRYLWKEQSLSASYLISTTLALMYILYLFPVNFIAGHGAFFERGEPLVSLSGWWSFKATAWQFPLFNTKLLNYPQGVNIAFTNSIPLLAILFKPIKYWLPSAFHYFGIWFGIAYIFQATSAVFLIRALGKRTLLASMSASTMALMMPAFLFQMEHIALLAHGYIISALALYFAGTENPRSFKSITFYFHILIALAFLTHPYLFSMVAVIYLAFLSDYYLKVPKDMQQCLIALATTTSIILGIMIVGGYFSQNMRAAGYSYYSMNLLAPFYGGKLGYPFINATGGQHRGFNYLGMGVIFQLVRCIALVFLSGRSRMQDLLQEMKQSVKQYRSLMISLLLLIIFAISNHIFYGSKPVLHYSLIHPLKLLTEIFPSSGRMFWPVGYVLMFIGLTGILRFENKKITPLILLIALGFQFYDTQPLRRNIYNISHKPSLIHPRWHRLMRSVSAVQVYPAYGCINATKNKSRSRNHIIFLQGLAARHGRPINTAYLARAKRPNCTAKHSAFNKKLVRGQLYIVTPAARHVPYHINKAIEYGWCRYSKHGILCVPHTNSHWWKVRTPPS